MSMGTGRKHTIGIAAVIAAIVLSGPAWADLVDHYEFENDGYDSAGGDANGFVRPNVGFTLGVIGMAAHFGPGYGVDDWIIVPKADAFDAGTGDFSMAFWVKRDQLDGGNADGVFDSLPGTTHGYQVNFTYGNHMTFKLESTSGHDVQVYSNTKITDTTDFHHFARICGQGFVNGNREVDLFTP